MATNLLVIPKSKSPKRNWYQTNNLRVRSNFCASVVFSFYYQQKRKLSDLKYFKVEKIYLEKNEKKKKLLRGIDFFIW